MNSFRFFNTGRNFFGSRLLEMNSSSIRRLCKSSKFHHSVKNQQTKVERLNLMTQNVNSHNPSSLTNAQSELCTELSDLPDTMTDTAVELMRLRGLITGQLNNLSSLRINELGKLNLMTQDQRMISMQGKWRN